MTGGTFSVIARTAKRDVAIQPPLRHPELVSGSTLDCFVAKAPRNDNIGFVIARTAKRDVAIQRRDPAAGRVLMDAETSSA
jgi:hypothetical protein